MRRSGSEGQRHKAEDRRPYTEDSNGESDAHMIVHVVLFRPKADLGAADRASLGAAIERAHREIPAVRRFLVGARTAREVSYASGMPDYPFIALIELDDERALQAYLAHPAHRELGRLFWETSDSALAYDFETVDASRISALLES
jgi:hypothetical protein